MTIAKATADLRFSLAGVLPTPSRLEAKCGSTLAISRGFSICNGPGEADAQKKEQESEHAKEITRYATRDRRTEIA